MASAVVLLLLLCLAAALALPRGPPRAASDEDKYKLPKGFLLGAGTSSYQTEGAWDADGKGVNVFDHYYHSLADYTAGSNGDMAADTYHRHEEDTKLAAELGLNVLRFSISWARIFPDGKKENVNQKGVQHYHNVLAAMKAKNIEPIVTIFHFDYPQALEEEFGGWLGDAMPDAFADYADFVFREYGSEVKYWLTVNEASFYCTHLAGSFFAPYTFNTTEEQNKCVKNTILAHAKAHKNYEENYKDRFGGLVGFGAGPMFSRPATDSDEDKAAAESANTGTGIGLTIDPLVFGDYPEAVRSSQLAFTEEEKVLIKGRIDFIGINCYGGQNASASSGGGGGGPPGDGSGGGGGGGPPGDGGSGGSGGHPGGFGGTESAWVLREMPLWVKNRYDSVKQLPIFITENGVNAEAEGELTALDDWNSRAVYCSAFLREMIAGINENGTRVFGYTAWSLVDTYEFRNGFSNWGLIHVDFAGGTLDRSLKASATLFKTIAKTGFVPLVETDSQPLPDPDATTTAAPTTAAASSTAPTTTSTTPAPSGQAGFTASAILTTLTAVLALACFQ